MAFPRMDHLAYTDFEHVYEPAEDTYALVDALEMEKEAIVADLPAVCVEIGCGSGAALTHLGLLLRARDVACVLLATDVNPVATRTTLRTSRHNDLPQVECIQCDLVLPLRAQLHGKVDILLFNPPYVPTEDSEVSMSGIAAAWAGGRRGRRVINRFLPLLPELLSPRGRCFMVTVEENNPREIMEWSTSHGLHCQTILTRKATNESLSILCFQRSPL